MTTEPADSAIEGPVHAEEVPPPDGASGAVTASDEAHPPEDAAGSEEAGELPAPESARDEPSEAAEPVAEPQAAGFAASRSVVPWWPFVAYDALWLVMAVAMVWLLTGVPDGVAAYDAPIYAPMLYAGIALTVFGAVLPFAVWAVAKRESGASAEPIFVPALLRGAVATMLGVAIWWTALGAVDYVRLGGML